MLPKLKLSLLSHQCLIAITTMSISSLSYADSPWKVTDGTTLTATTSYSGRTVGDYPLYVSGDNSVLQTIAGLDFRTSGDNYAAAQVLDLGTLNLESSTLVTRGANSHGINVDNGTVNINGGSITVGGDNSDGIHADNGATLNLNGVAITADGVGGNGIALKNGSLTATDVNIFGNGQAGNGLKLFVDNTASDSQATLKNVDIVMRGNANSGLLLGNGSVNADELNISANGRTRGIEINSASNGRGIMTLDNSNIHTSEGEAIYVQSGDIAISNTIINTDSGIGINVGDNATATFNGGSITSQDDDATAISVAGNNSSVTLSDTTLTTYGNAAHTLFADAGGTINADHIQALTHGQDAYILAAHSGNFNISNSQLETLGDAPALYVTSDTGFNTSNVVLDNTSLVSKSGSAVMADGAALDLTVKNGSQLIAGNGILLDSKSGTQPSRVSLKAENDVLLSGDIIAESNNRVDVDLAQSSQLTGAILNGSAMTIDGSSRWLMTKNSDLKSLASAGMIEFAHSDDGFKTLALGDLSGNSQFAMTTDLQKLTGDLITVSGNATGDHVLSINNTGLEPGETHDVLAVVKTAGNGDEQFTLQNGVVDAGTYQYELKHQDNDWVLAQKFKEGGGGDDGGDPVVTPSTATALGIFNAMPSAWYGEMTTLRTRLGDVRQGKQTGGAWVRGVGGEFKMHDANGEGYSQNQSGISVGVDSAIDVGQSQMLLGLFSGYSRSNLAFTHNSSGTIDSFFIGGYSTFLLQDGWFIDNVIKANNFSNHTNARMSDGQLAKGGYSTPAFGLSVELGKRIDFDGGWFAEPSVQLSSVWIKGTGYRLDNGLKADSDMATSKQAALHGVVGKNIELENGMTIQPWIRASLIEEFAKNNKVHINDNGFNNDMSGVQGKFTLGTSAQLTQDVQLYSEANYSKGSKTETPWNASVGVRWSW
ncbi:MAG TPA: autotransporter outer membrane beta-barrel domain-containing protein [Pantoea sp.]|nr:autotransporter outer membrane beta-barrel domain-containing protein [Pantoea sp.]